MTARPPTASRYLSPPEVAKRLGISSEKVRMWIKAGELRAVNVATSTAGRPRWRIDPTDLAAFLELRAARPTPKVVRRRRRDPQITRYF